jgi:hypothetical protein
MYINAITNLTTVVIEWLLTGSITQLVLAIISKDTLTPLERWVFDINLVEQPGTPGEEYDFCSYGRFKLLITLIGRLRPNQKQKFRQRYDRS